MTTLYKPLALVIGLLGGLPANAVFKQVWQRVDDEDQTPDPMQSGDGWKRILSAAALQGAIYSLVKAAVNRGGAKGFEKATGAWPGKTDKDAKAA